MIRLHRAFLRPLLPVLLVTLATTAQAQQQLTFADQGDSTTASITDNGRRVAFLSSAKLVVGDQTGVDAFVVDGDGSDTIRLTGGQLTARPPMGGGGAAIAGDGSVVILVSTGNPSGENPDGGTELFAVDPDGTGVTQITNTGVSAIRAPSPSSDGSRIAFTAAGDLLQDGSNSDGSREVFVVDADGDKLVQITRGPFGTQSRFPDISANGNQVVFSSNTNPSGDNADGNSEIFVAESDGSDIPMQLTDAVTGQSLRPSIAGIGLVAFQSSANLDSDNIDTSVEIFVVDADGGAPRQITDSATGDSTRPVIAAAGARIAFQSNANLTGSNRDGRFEIFIANRDGSDIDQLTESPGPSTRPAISASGDRVAFQSSADLTNNNTSGNNASGNTEIFVINPIDDASADTDDETGSLFCSGGSGCVLCFDDEDDDNDALVANGRPMDPTFALLILLAGFRLTRRRHRP